MQWQGRRCRRQVGHSRARRHTRSIHTTLLPGALGTIFTNRHFLQSATGEKVCPARFFSCYHPCKSPCNYPARARKSYTCKYDAMFAAENLLLNRLNGRKCTSVHMQDSGVSGGREWVDSGCRVQGSGWSGWAWRQGIDDWGGGR